MTQTFEQQAGLPAPYDRALLVAEFITRTVATRRIPDYPDIPFDPDFTFIIDDPTGHFPLQAASPLQLRFEVGQRDVGRVYAVSGSTDPRLQEVATLRETGQYKQARTLARMVPGLRQFTFRSPDLTDNFKIIRPVNYYPDL